MVYVKLVFILSVAEYCLAAPKPIEWDEIGRKIKSFGEKALPVARGACGVLNNIPVSSGYPQFQGYYPQVQPYYPPTQSRGFPQAPGFPTYVPPNQNYPQFGGGFPQYPSLTPGYSPANPPVSSGNVANQGGTTLEQDDMNKADGNPLGIPPYIPPTDDEDNFDLDSEEREDLSNIIPGVENTPKDIQGLFKAFSQPKEKYRARS